ncbi:MAG: hypothetical protein ACRETD_12200, partial [Steroidobacteraceae bacterium]
MDSSETDSERAAEPVFPRSHRLIRRLTLLFGLSGLAVGALLSAALLPTGAAPQLQSLAQEAIAGGLAGTVLSALLLSFTGLLATLVLTSARFRHSTTETARVTVAAAGWRDVLAHPGAAARQGQAIIVPAGAVLIFLVTRVLWPTAATVVDSTSANIAAAFVFALAFISLVAERVMNAFPAPQLPEAPTLRRLLLLTSLLLAGDACIELGRGAMLEWLRWPQWVLATLPALVALELALR